jgi:hypothetical protein
VARWEAEFWPATRIIDCDLFKATGEFTLQLKIRVRTSALVAKGKRIDEVDSCSKVLQNFNFTGDEQQLAKDPIYAAWDATHDMPCPYSTGEGWTKALMLTTICGMTHRRQAATEPGLYGSFCRYLHYALMIDVCYDSLKAKGLLNKRTCITERISSTVNPLTVPRPGCELFKRHKILEEIGREHDYRDYLTVMLFYSNQRRLFFTSKYFVGMGPAAMAKGDIVCVLYGGRVPYILRLREDHYELIGKCYLHGFMQGEVVNMKCRKPEWFELR